MDSFECEYGGGGAASGRRDANSARADTKRDKKKHTIHTKLSKLEENFRLDKDFHYRSSLQTIQKQLVSLNQGDVSLLGDKIKDFEELRDYDLVQLKLFREYELQNCEMEFQEQLEKANKEHDEMVKLVKEKLYANLEKQIKQLKEDKVLLDLANFHSYSMDTSDFHKNTRSSQSLKNSSISSIGYASDRRAGLRRRGANGNDSSNNYNSGGEHSTHEYDSANDSGNNSAAAANRKRQRPNGYGHSSQDELSLLSDHGDLSSILSASNSHSTRERASTRHSSKSFQPPSGLKQDEVDTDLAVLRSA